MKVAYLTPEFPHEKTLPSAGIGVSILNLSEGLIQLNHDVIIIVYGQDKDEIIEEGCLTIYKVRNIKVKGLSLYLTQKKVQRLINRLHSLGRVDLVEAPDWTGFTSFVNLKCALIIKLHGSDTYFCHLDNRQVKLKNKFLEKLALNKADGIIAVSNFVGELTNKVFNLNFKYNVIPNAINLTLFSPVKTKPKRVNIFYFGTLIRKKGVLEIPHIFNKVNKVLPNVWLIMVGKDAPDIKTGKMSTWELMQNKFSESAKMKVEYKGQVSYSKIKGYINDATVCIFPSFAEAFPLSWLEAMAMEKAIVASNIGWAPEVIDNGINGLLVEPIDHSEFADNICELIENESLRKKISLEARIKVQKMFDRKTVAEKHLEYYETILVK